MARITCAVILLAVNVKSESLTVKNSYAGLYGDISSVTSGVLEMNRRLTNTEVWKND